MKLIEKILIRGEVIAETGLMIGGSDSSINIGGADKQIVRHPVTMQPYIPGSSLKGKMRALLEIRYGALDFDDNNGLSAGPSQDLKHDTTKLFGCIKGRTGTRQQPSRIIVRDCPLMNPEQVQGSAAPHTELKAENSIDRITAAANPRFFERVPKGARFGMSIVLNIFEGGLSSKESLSLTYEGFRLLQDDYLGGGGSRGSGRISIHIQSITRRTADYYSSMAPTEKDQISETVPTEFQYGRAIEL